MDKMYDISEIQERVILVGVSVNDNDDTEKSLEELSELVKTAGAVSIAKVIQNREARDNATYVGKGKVEEIRLLIDELDATGIVCDDELTPAQLKNLKDELQTKVMDRTLVRQQRLAGSSDYLSRLGGGIGTRGPGEKKLEVDRRLIRDRISTLRQEIESLKKHRELGRSLRQKNHTKVISIVGYTNAGKSTLLNHLTGADVFEENELFATLDPTTRSYKMQSGQEVLFTDTVGFIRKLPHNLIDAFKSTLEEAKYADILVHVVDA